MLDQFYSTAEKKMDSTIDALKRDLGSISTGRATPNLLDPVKVEVYGSHMPLSQMATISTPDATTISIQVWDKGNVNAVEKAIVNANLGFNPRVDGTLMRIQVPGLTEERRREFTKLAKKYGEDKKVSIRNARREAIDSAKKADGISEDEVKGFEGKIQKLTDEFVKKIDDLVSKKEKDIMTI